jgi:hypothetical protein
MFGFLRIKSSASWLKIATRIQEGYATNPDAPTAIGSSLRKLWRKIGSDMRSANKKYFFLKKSTKELKTPARPIIEPFWAAYKADADRNITSNFNKKMRGDRI